MMIYYTGPTFSSLVLIVFPSTPLPIKTYTLQNSYCNCPYHIVTTCVVFHYTVNSVHICVYDDVL